MGLQGTHHLQLAALAEIAHGADFNVIFSVGYVGKSSLRNIIKKPSLFNLASGLPLSDIGGAI